METTNEGQDILLPVEVYIVAQGSSPSPLPTHVSRVLYTRADGSMAAILAFADTMPAPETIAREKAALRAYAAALAAAPEGDTAL